MAVEAGETLSLLYNKMERSAHSEMLNSTKKIKQSFKKNKIKLGVKHAINKNNSIVSYIVFFSVIQRSTIGVKHTIAFYKNGEH